MAEANKLKSSRSLPEIPAATGKDGRSGDNPYRSVNPLPNVQRGLPPEVIRRAFFSTTNGGALPNHFKDGGQLHAGRAVVDRVHYRNLTQPLGWRRSEAPGITKDFCTYHSEFIPRSLENAKVDREIASVFKENSRSGGDANTGQKLSSDTTSKAALPKHTKDGRGQNYKPEQPIHIDINSRLLETQSRLRQDYPAHDQRMAHRLRGERVEPFSNPVEYGKPFIGQTQFSRDYSAPANFRPGKYPNPVPPMKR